MAIEEGFGTLVGVDDAVYDDDCVPLKLLDVAAISEDALGGVAATCFGFCRRIIGTAIATAIITALIATMMSIICLRVKHFRGGGYSFGSA